MNTIKHFRIKKMSPQLLVADIEHSLEFYTKKMGFAIDFRYDDFYAGIIKDDCSIHLKSGQPSIEERKNNRSNEDLDIVFSVEEIENVYKEMESESVEIIQPLRRMAYGKEFYVTDPDGNILAFMEA